MERAPTLLVRYQQDFKNKLLEYDYLLSLEDHYIANELAVFVEAQQMLEEVASSQARYSKKIEQLQAERKRIVDKRAALEIAQAWFAMTDEEKDRTPLALPAEFAEYLPLIETLLDVSNREEHEAPSTKYLRYLGLSRQILSMPDRATLNRVHAVASYGISDSIVKEERDSLQSQLQNLAELPRLDGQPITYPSTYAKLLSDIPDESLRIVLSERAAILEYHLLMSYPEFKKNGIRIDRDFLLNGTTYAQSKNDASIIREMGGTSDGVLVFKQYLRENDATLAQFGLSSQELTQYLNTLQEVMIARVTGTIAVPHDGMHLASNILTKDSLETILREEDPQYHLDDDIHKAIVATLINEAIDVLTYQVPGNFFDLTVDSFSDDYLKYISNINSFKVMAVAAKVMARKQAGLPLVEAQVKKTVITKDSKEDVIEKIKHKTVLLYAKSRDGDVTDNTNKMYQLTTERVAIMQVYLELRHKLRKAKRAKGANVPELQANFEEHKRQLKQLLDANTQKITQCKSQDAEHIVNREAVRQLFEDKRSYAKKYASLRRLSGLFKIWSFIKYKKLSPKKMLQKLEREIIFGDTRVKRRMRMRAFGRLSNDNVGKEKNLTKPNPKND